MPEPAQDIPKRLEELRAEIRAERISYGELAELQGLAEHIDPGDVELLQWAGVPEFPDDSAADLPDVTITLPQNVWEAVENALVAQVAEITAIPGDVDDTIVLLERAISALKGDDDDDA